jgi:hypothetical protein
MSMRLYTNPGEKHRNGGPVDAYLRAVKKAPKGGPPQSTDVLYLEMVPNAKGRKGC